MSFTLKACRVNRNLTQAEAAKALGVTEDTLANYEAGRTFPDVRVIKKIERLYNVPFADIIFFEE
jgi:transcriptional regulator with XRE-family HTH domain